MKKMPETAYVKIPTTRVPDLVKKVYDMSIPVGLGIMHHRPGPLDDATLESILSRGPGHVHMDYVRGRQCKFSTRASDSEDYVLIHPTWYDHSDKQLVELLTHIGIENAAQVIADAAAARMAYFDELNAETL